MLNCYDKCSFKTITTGTDVKKGKHMMLKHMKQEIYNVLESQLEAKQDPLLCLKWQQISMFSRINHAHENYSVCPKFHTHLASRIAFQNSLTLLDSAVQRFRCEGLFFLASASNPGNHSSCVVSITPVTDHLSTTSSALGTWDASSNARQLPVGYWTELINDFFTDVKGTEV